MGDENRITIIGIDCATKPEKQGLAVSIYQNHHLKLKSVYPRSTIDLIIDEIGKASKNVPILFTFDAPLGWPAPLGQNLSIHSAGKYVNEDANLLFQRETDRVVKQKINKLPLEVGVLTS